VSNNESGFVQYCHKDGSAFRNARILPAYRDARLAELKWAVVVAGVGFEGSKRNSVSKMSAAEMSSGQRRHRRSYCVKRRGEALMPLRGGGGKAICPGFLTWVSQRSLHGH